MPFIERVEYVDPFEDTTADDTVELLDDKPVPGEVGISPITTQGAVSVADEETVDAAQPATINEPISYIDEINNNYLNLDSRDLRYYKRDPDVFSSVSAYDTPLYSGRDYQYALSQASNLPLEEQQTYIDSWKSEKRAERDAFNQQTQQELGSLINPFVEVATSVGDGSFELNLDYVSRGFQTGTDLYKQFLQSAPEGLTLDEINKVRQAAGVDEWRGTPSLSMREEDLPAFQEDINGIVANFEALPENFTTKDVTSAFSGYLDPNYTPTVDSSDVVTDRMKSKYGFDLTDEQYQTYNSLLKGIVAEDVAKRTGLRYELALEYALYKNPAVKVLNSMYGLDGNAGTRSTGDGSMYILDPLSGQELRTLEVKDPNFGRTLFKTAMIATTAAVLGPAIQAAVMPGTAAAATAGATTAGTAATSGTAAGATAGASGAAAGTTAATTTAAAAPSLISSATTALGKAAINTTLQAAITEATGGDFDFNAESFVGSVLLQGATDYAASVRTAADNAYAVLNTVEIPPPGAFESYAALNTQANILDAISNTATAAAAIESGDYLGAFNSLFELGTSAASGFETSGVDAIATVKDSAMDYVSAFAADTFGTEGEWFGANVDDLTNGVMDYAQRVMNGDDPVDALGSAVNEYAKNGGSLGVAGESARDFIEQAGGSFYDNVIKPIGDVLADGYKTVANAVPDNFDTPDVLKELEDAAKTAGSELEDAVRDVGGVIDDNVTQPVKEVVEEVYESIPNPSFAGDDTPDVDLPSVDVDVDVPSFGLDFGGGSGGGLLSEATKRDASGIPQIRQVEEAELFAYTDYLNKLLRG